MSIEDTIGYDNETVTCVVCGRAMKPRDAQATLYQGKTKLPICCPLCLETYEKNPKPYLERLAKQFLHAELSKQHPPTDQH